MANTRKRQREAALETEAAQRERAAALAMEERADATRFIVALLSGALATIAVLALLRIGARELWSPFAQSGASLLRALLISGACGGAVAALCAQRLTQRDAHSTLAPGACALGWALWGALQHLRSPSTFSTFIPQATKGAGAFEILMSNAAQQSLCVALALAVASGTSWIVRRRLVVIGRIDESSDTPQKAPRQSLSRVLSFSLLVVFIGGALLWTLGWIPQTFVPPLNIAQLPGPISLAVLCAVIAMLAFGIAAYVVSSFGARRAPGSVVPLGVVLAAPLTVWLVTAIAQSGKNNAHSLLPAAALIWNSSPLELASWSALGAAIGFWLAQANSE